MCGMGGIMAHNMIDNEIEIGRRIGLLNHFRGEDAVGLFDYVPGAKEKDQINYWKLDEHPVNFLGKPFVKIRDTRWKTNKPKLFAIHCRAATQGKLNEKNAHPFAFSKVVGMHNGTISKDFTNRAKFDTDSEAIYYNINKMGLNGALDAIRHLEPAYALVWLNWQDGTLNFIRNYRRPLHFTKIMGDSSLCWSSEEDHLKMAIGSVMKSMTPIIKPFRVGIHYKIGIDEKKIDFEETEIPEAKEPVSYTSGNTFSGQSTSKNYSSYPPSYNPHSGGTHANTSMANENSSAHWETYGKDPAETRFNYDLYQCYDEHTGLFFTTYAYNRLLALRAVETQALLTSPPTKENNVVPIRKEEKTTSQSDPLNDPLPWGDEDEISGMVNHETGSEGGYAFGPGFKRTCSRAAYLQKLSQCCTSCGNESKIDELVFWLTDDEHICANCTEDIITNPKHWIRSGGGLSDQQIERLTKEFTEMGFEDAPAEEKVAVH